MRLEQPIFALPVSADGSPPAEFRLFAHGDNETTKGTFRFTDRSAEAVSAEYIVRAIERHGDYEHFSLDKTARPEQQVASCWYRLDLRDGELWATDVRWTPEADRQIRNKERRYISPAFDTNEDGEILRYRNLALTNDPATLAIAPLVAATHDPAAVAASNGATPMAEEKKDEKSEMSERMKKCKALVDDMMKCTDEEEMAKHAKALGALFIEHKEEEEMSDKDDKEAVEAKALTADLVTLTGKSSRGEIAATVRALIESKGQNVALSARVEAMEARERAADFAAACEEGKRAGKLTPVLLKSDWIVGLGKQVDGAKHLRSYLAAAPVLVTATDSATTEQASSATVTLTDEDKRMGARFGLTEEQLLATKRQALANSR